MCARRRDVRGAVPRADPTSAAEGRPLTGREPRRGEADVVERLVGPLLDVRGGVALRRNGTFGCGLGCQGQGPTCNGFLLRKISCENFRAKSK